MTAGIASQDDLDLLARLGFAPNAPLMNEPHVLVDPRYVHRLRRQLAKTLGSQAARRVESQIGLFHGLREGRRAVGGPLRPVAEQPGIPSVAVTVLGRSGHRDQTVRGRWARTVETAGAARASGDMEPGDCLLTAGYTSGWLSEIHGSSIVAVETSCRSRGDAFCAFDARPAEQWRARGDARAVRLARDLPFETFRGLLRDRPESSAAADTAVATAYAWGPVLILPFQPSPVGLGPLEPVPGVRVVVVDFCGLAFDRENPSGDAMTRLHSSLEALLDSLVSWGVEPVLAALPAPLASRLGQLRGAPHLVRPNLAEALAAAFQIARSQDVIGRLER